MITKFYLHLLIVGFGFFLVTICPELEEMSYAHDKHRHLSQYYVIRGSNARLNREVQGSIVDSVDGVPAAPVDSFVWDGVGSISTEGHITIKIDPVANKGKIKALWHDRNGFWRYQQTVYLPPDHPSGLRLGSSADPTDPAAVDLVEIKDDLTTTEDESDPVTTNIYLHGNTGSGGPILPTLFNLLATWGPAKIWLNGKLFNNPYDGPAPLWVGHTMTTEGARNSDGSVRTTDGSIYNPMVSDQGAVDPKDWEVHLVFHDAPQPNVTGNIPGMFSFFYHLVFEDVKINIVQK